MKISIRAKIIGGFAAIFITGIVLGLYGLYSINKISTMSAEQSKIQDANSSILDVLGAHYIWRQNLTVAVFTNTDFTGSYDSSNCTLGKWRNNDVALETANDEIKALLTQIDVPHNYIHKEAENIMGLMKNGNIEQAQKEFIENIQPNANEAISLLVKMTEQYKILLDNQTNAMHEFQNTTLMVIISLLAIATILSVGLSIVIINSIMKPLKTLAESANTVASGNFSVNFSYSVNDEIGILTRNFASLVDTFKLLISDMNKMSEKHTAGDIDYFMETDKYNGEFQDVVSGINFMIKEYVENTITMLNVVQEYADGDFSAKLKPYPGKKALANTILDSVSNNLKTVERSVMFLVTSTLEGELDKRVDDTKFKGDWKGIISGMNQLLEAIDAPLVEVQSVLSLVSEGKLDAKVVGKYKGRFQKMSASINKTIDVLSMYINEISYVLTGLADNNLDQGITKEYVGEFSSIKDALNNIINKLNTVISDILSAANQVSDGAKMISESSMTLAQGATEQASSVEELNATIMTIHQNTTENAQSAKEAEGLSASSKDNAAKGEHDMNNMLVSMDGIKESSNSISRIIKVIDDIAFQTNLLALNAAVEAARAGQHGKGFAVVAEEVRNLAGRSQAAAKETADLIEESISRVDEGTKIAGTTANALQTIVGDVTKVAGIIAQIAEASNEQTISTGQVTEGISQIAAVVQSNSATSEEAASASQQLASQAEVMKDLVSVFNLKKNI